MPSSLQRYAGWSKLIQIVIRAVLLKENRGPACLANVVTVVTIATATTGGVITITVAIVFAISAVVMSAAIITFRRRLATNIQCCR